MASVPQTMTSESPLSIPADKIQSYFEFDSKVTKDVVIAAYRARFEAIAVRFSHAPNGDNWGFLIDVMTSYQHVRYNMSVKVAD